MNMKKRYLEVRDNRTGYMLLKHECLLPARYYLDVVVPNYRFEYVDMKWSEDNTKCTVFVQNWKGRKEI